MVTVERVGCRIGLKRLQKIQIGDSLLGNNLINPTASNNFIVFGAIEDFSLEGSHGQQQLAAPGRHMVVDGLNRRQIFADAIA